MGLFLLVATVSMAASNIVFTRSAFGRVPMVQLTTRPSKQSIRGERYTFPAGIWNSVMLVSHFSLGVAAWKSRLMRFSGAGLISPMYEPYRRFLLAATIKHSCFIKRCTTFSQRCRWRLPSAARSRL